MTKNTTYTPPAYNYQGQELRPVQGIPAKRMQAFALPSRMGDRLHYPDGRVLPFPGSVKDSTKPD